MRNFRIGFSNFILLFPVSEDFIKLPKIRFLWALPPSSPSFKIEEVFQGIGKLPGYSEFFTRAPEATRV